MDAIEFVTTVEKICNAYSCDDCVLGAAKNKRGITCEKLKSKHIDEYVVIVEKWLTDHSKVTNLDKFVEVFGFFPYDSGTQCFGFLCEDGVECKKCPNRGYWGNDYKKPRSEEDDKS